MSKNAEQPKPKIFINYRHGDTKIISHKIATQLKKECGEKNIFIDRDMSPGENLKKRINKELNQCDVLLAMIGRQWDNRDNLSKLNQRDDWVANEIAIALSRGDVRVVPVLIDRTSMPEVDELPSDIKELTNRLAATYNRRNNDISDILRALGIERQP